jgi:hypothetical protein
MNMDKSPITNTGAIANYLNFAEGGLEAADPIPLPVELDFGTTGNGWADILSAINTAGRYVALDLSACTGVTEFDPNGTTSGGKDKIVSLVLPDTTESIKEDGFNSLTFRNFTNLKMVSGASVKSIGYSAFRGCTTLTMVSLPAFLSSIGAGTFAGCINLGDITIASGNSVYKHSADHRMILSKDDTTTLLAFPSAGGTVTLDGITVIGRGAFSGCTALKTVSLPAVKSIGEYAFVGCTALSTLYSPRDAARAGVRRVLPNQ